MGKTLSVRRNGTPVGLLTQDENGRLGFAYDETWLTTSDAHPISLSMPLDGGPFGDRQVKAFFGGYLPDSDTALAQIAGYFKISPTSMFRMLSAVGRDCAGAISLHPPDAPVRPDDQREPKFSVLDEVALAATLRELTQRPLGAGRDKLRLSLAGAQSKTALYVTDDGRLALPEDDYPTSHIIKPELSSAFPDIALIEYFSLELARSLGLPVPKLEYGHAQEVPYLLVERYDRIRHPGGQIERIHQEDFCQACGIRSRDKYETDGGPDLVRCFELLDRMRAPARERLKLLDLILFNFVIGNHDAHAKNFSILYTPDGPTLAPLYDVVSVLIYEDRDRRRTQRPSDPPAEMDARMAMRIGGTYEDLEVRPSHWKAFAAQTGFTWRAVRQRLDRISRAVQFEAPRVERTLAEASQTTPVFHRAVELILARAKGVRLKHDLEPVPPKELPSRILFVGVEESVQVGDDVAVTASKDERLLFDQTYRLHMTRLAERQQRAALTADEKEERQLGDRGRLLTEAYQAWRRGEALDDEQIARLEEALGAIPGRTTGAVRPERESPSLQMPEPEEAVARAQRAQSYVMPAADLKWPDAVVLCAVPGQHLDFLEWMLSENSPLHRLLASPPRWRPNGYDLYVGDEVESRDGNVLRVATPGYGAIDVWRDGTVAVAFELGLMDVPGQPGRRRFSPLGLAERVSLFLELAEAVFSLVADSVAIAQFSIRMHSLQSGSTLLRLGPDLVGTYGWLFGKGYRAAEIDGITEESTKVLPSDTERVAYELFRHVYRAFGLAIDKLPLLEVRDGQRVLSKRKFLEWLQKMPSA